MTRQLPTTIITTSFAYTAHLHRSVSVGALASYLSRLENNIDARTLEIARALPLDMRVQAINMQAGDRLLIANDPIKVTPLPVPPRAGAQFVRVKSDAIDLKLPTKQKITVGWSDKLYSTIADVDLRVLAPPDALPYIAQDCMQIQRENESWYATRTGDTRIDIDELELYDVPVRLNPQQRVKIYAQDNRYPRVIFDLLLETVEARETVAPLPSGSMVVSIQPGVEGSTRFLRASPRLTLRQIVAALAQHDVLALGNASVYLAHALPLETPLYQITDDETFLHVPLDIQHARRVLQLQDIFHAGQVYSVRSGRADARTSIGWRVEAGVSSATPDLDLYPSLTAVPSYFSNSAQIKAYLHYNAFAETWSLSTVEGSEVDVFINSMQVGKLPMRIATGDIITFGSRVDNPLVRLRTDISVE